jgi:hypothetical protein
MQLKKHSAERDVEKVMYSQVKLNAMIQMILMETDVTKTVNWSRILNVTIILTSQVNVSILLQLCIVIRLMKKTVI